MCKKQKKDRQEVRLLKDPTRQRVLTWSGRWMFLSAAVFIPLARRLHIDPFCSLEVVEADDFIVDRGELDAALVPGQVQRRRWLG